jgi:hypothetical protein
MDISENNTIVILIILIILVLYLLLKSSSENFDNNINLDNIQNEINRVYNLDIEAMKNLGAISKSLLTGKDYYTTKPSTPGNLNIPTDSTIINGNFIVGGFNILDKLNSISDQLIASKNNLQAQITNMILPKNTSVVFTSPVPADKIQSIEYYLKDGKNIYYQNNDRSLYSYGQYTNDLFKAPPCPGGWIHSGFDSGFGKLATKSKPADYWLDGLLYQESGDESYYSPASISQSTFGFRLELNTGPPQNRWGSGNNYTNLEGRKVADGPLVYLNLCHRP